MPSHVKGQPTSEKQKIASRKWYAKLKEEQPERLREIRHRTDALSVARQLARLEAMAGPCPDQCEICGGPPNGRGRFHFDHDHETGQFRGWLCAKCNWAIGLMEDNPDLMMSLALYLEKAKREPSGIFVVGGRSQRLRVMKKEAIS
jgi:hypothetical protein